MLKTLIKKQLMETWKFLFFDPKKGTRRTKKSAIGYGVLLVAIFGYLMVIFGMMTSWLGETMFPLGLGWFCYLLVAMLGIVYGVFASVFNTYSTVYLPKDNDILIPLPIKESDLVISRLAGVWVMGLFYEALIFVPGIIVGQVITGFNLSMLIGCIIMMFVTSFFVVALSALLGYVVAVISVKLKSKAFVTVLVSLGFMGAYWYVYTKILNGLDSLITMAESASLTVKNKAFLLYHLGQGCMGKPMSILIQVVFVGICTFITYYLLKRSFNRIATINKGEKKVEYKMEHSQAKSVSSALLRKEVMRFTKSATYMLNCGLGVLMMPLAAVFVIIKSDTLSIVTDIVPVEYAALLPLVICGMVAMISSMNDTAAPSVSLEGKNIWILQSLPVDPWEVLKAKLKLHCIITIPPAFLLTIVLDIILKVSITDMIMSVVLVGIFVLMMASLGLIGGIKMPNLKWTNETVAVKQSMAVMVALFGGWVLVITCGLAVYLLRNMVSLDVFIPVFIVVFSLVTRYALTWLQKRGSVIFSEL